MTYQCLRDRSIHAIHGHMVTIISRPSKSQLRQITCTDQNRAILICTIHKDLCSLPCLTVLISHIMHRRIMSNIPEMYIYCFFDIDLT